jgi:hypothetical protein
MYTNGGLNAFIPTAEKALQSNFSRNVKDYLLNSYTTVAKVDQPTFYDTYHSPSAESRISPSNLANHVWIDGSMPQVNFAKQHNFNQHTCTRYQDSFTIGDVAQQTAKNNWDLITDHANSAASNLMTIRTYNVLNTLINASWGGNTATATSIGGGKWNVAGDPPANYIQISIQAGYIKIQKGTNAVVNPQDLTLVVSPDLATAMSQTTEIRNYLKSSPYSMNFLENKVSNGFAYGLPNNLYGVNVLVEPTVVNSSQLGIADSTSYILGSTNALLLSRPGAVTGPLQTMSCSTLGLYEDMSIVMEHSTIGKLTNAVLSDYYVPIVRPQLGFLFTACQ